MSLSLGTDTLKRSLHLQLAGVGYGWGLDRCLFERCHGQSQAVSVGMVRRLLMYKILRKQHTQELMIKLQGDRKGEVKAGLHIASLGDRKDGGVI